MSEFPVNPEIMRWARESSGLTIEEVVGKFNRQRITFDVIQSWEEGSESPNYTQLERLAYDIYKRPLAIFFFPEPPEETSPQHSFRTLPDYEIEQMPAKIRLLLRKASALQLNLSELYEGINYSDKQIVRDLSFETNTPATDIAIKVREYLAVDLEDQIELQDSEHAFKFWREKLEDHGVFIFKDAFREESFSGFCLYNNRFPVIYVNNSKPFTRQAFTLFHELAHLLFKTGGIDTKLDNYIDYLDGDDRIIEILCNQFAGEFLVPSQDFNKQSASISIDEDTIINLANRYHVSREVILRKFFDLGRVNQQDYSSYVASWDKKYKHGRGSGGNYYLNMGVYLGERYIERAFNRYHQDYIAIEQLADYLGVKVKNVPGMEAHLFHKGTPT